MPRIRQADNHMSRATCRICNTSLEPWRFPWLGYAWGSCPMCKSVQKILTETEYSLLDPTYDPGYESSGASKAELLKHLNVDEKQRLLVDAFGNDVKGRMLDIGCGMGGYLLAGKRLGLDVTGVEPSASHSKAAVEIFDLDVVHGYFKPDVFVEAFDVIVLSHVIEHIYDPKKFLIDIISVLRPGGKLLIITPNVESISASWCRHLWSMYKPVDHVTMLGKSTIPYLIPDNAVIMNLATREWSGEFGAHILSACRTVLHPEIGNKGGRSAAVPTGRSTLGGHFKLILAVASWPFQLLGRLLDRQSCLYSVIGRRVDEV